MPDFIDSKVSAYPFCKSRLAHGGEASKLAFVTIVAKPECASSSRICLSEAVDRGDTSQPFIAALNFLDLAIRKPLTAVIDVITAAVSSDQ